MGRPVILSAICILAGLLPAATLAQSSPAGVGAGPHGYDFLLGSWACANSMPSAMGGPANTTVAISKSADPNAFAVRSTGTNYDSAGYLTFSTKTSTWWGPSVFSNGGYGTESSHDSGATTHWVGTFFDPSTGAPAGVRDTYVVDTMAHFLDTTEIQVNGNWATVAKVTCTKS